MAVIAGTKMAALAAPLRVLLVGQREEDFFLIREILSQAKAGAGAELEQAVSIEEAKAMLREKQYGLVLFDYQTPNDAAVGLLAEFVKTGPSIPFILLTENADEDEIAKILEAGTGDCIEKSDLSGANLMRTMRCTLALHAMQAGRSSAEESLRKLLPAVEQSADTVLITDRDGRIEYVNPAFERLTGYSAKELAGQTPRILKSGEQSADLYQDLWKKIAAGEIFRGILVNRKKNGELYYTEESISPVRDADGAITHFIANGRDLTERLRLEAQLLQAQKMDAIGRLAGGVAHDFNNLLTIIISYAELAMDAVDSANPLACKLQEIVSAGRRAAQLTRQLLAFSRKQPQVLRVLDLNGVIADITPTLQRLMGEDIRLIFRPDPKLGRVRVDSTQMEQILLNLAANSRDAMPLGGTLKIESSDIYLDDEYVQHKQAVVPKGRYALLTITDTGAGISPDHLPHIFEPFYTTKPSGKGTGLGLATVYGIVKQNKGFIWAYSEVGMGTVFKIYLPCVTNCAEQASIARPVPESAARGSETLLLVEDEDAVRHATSEFLSLQGYTVLQAKDGLDALSIAKNYDSTIHLVVSDVVMPNMSGGQLAKELEAVRPEAKVLFVSGYAGKTVVDHKVLDLETNFLQKPFTLKQLGGKIREALERRGRERCN